MVDDIALSHDALHLIKSPPSDGDSMIATSRAIFSGTYGDEVHQSDIFDVFQLVCDESDNFVLDRFGSLNSIHKSSKPVYANNNREEIDSIFNSYISQFEVSIIEFRRRFDI